MVAHGDIVGVGLDPPAPNLQGVVLDGDGGATDRCSAVVLTDKCDEELL
jgi:hypothetical protein